MVSSPSVGVCKPVTGRLQGWRLAETTELLAGPSRAPPASRLPPPAAAATAEASAAPRGGAGRGGGGYFCSLSAARVRRGRGSRRHIPSRRRPRGAATMSTAAFHISSLLEKMTSSDKDFRCARCPAPASPPRPEPPALPSRSAGPPPGPCSPHLCSSQRAPLLHPRRPLPASAPGGSSGCVLRGLLALSSPGLQTSCVSHRANFSPCLPSRV
ncbi:hypothetical protein J1605_005394 [Eschrichtius robustus]|uniref:Uncharacterized protein n=1 Tax=Eschrichtius robustus TaxID=9764 RepID=A0AB34HAX8_ESCRO|nr:hypothetical protein J1605_005394 [Eschrichtius robustus]